MALKCKNVVFGTLLESTDPLDLVYLDRYLVSRKTETRKIIENQGIHSAWQLTNIKSRKASLEFPYHCLQAKYNRPLIQVPKHPGSNTCQSYNSKKKIPSGLITNSN